SPNTSSPARYTLSLHDALPIYPRADRGDAARARGGLLLRLRAVDQAAHEDAPAGGAPRPGRQAASLRSRDRRLHGGRLPADRDRSEEHTSELQSRFDLVCSLLL